MNEYINHDEIPYIPMSMKVDLVIALLKPVTPDKVTLSEFESLIIDHYMTEIKEHIEELENGNRNHLGGASPVTGASE